MNKIIYIITCIKAFFLRGPLFYVCKENSALRAVPTYRFHKFMGIPILGILNDPVIKTDLQYSENYEGIEKDDGKLMRKVNKNFVSA